MPTPDDAALCPAPSANIYLRRRLSSPDALPPINMAQVKDVVFWRFVTGSAAFCACSLLPLLLQL